MAKEAKQKACPHCGQVLSLYAVKCRSCGQDVEGYEETAVAPAPAAKPGRPLLRDPDLPEAIQEPPAPLTGPPLTGEWQQLRTDIRAAAERPVELQPGWRRLCRGLNLVSFGLSLVVLAVAIMLLVPLFGARTISFEQFVMVLGVAMVVALAGEMIYVLGLVFCCEVPYQSQVRGMMHVAVIFLGLAAAVDLVQTVISISQLDQDMARPRVSAFFPKVPGPTLELVLLLGVRLIGTVGWFLFLFTLVGVARFFRDGGLGKSIENFIVFSILLTVALFLFGVCAGMQPELIVEILAPLARRIGPETFLVMMVLVILALLMVVFFWTIGVLQQTRRVIEWELARPESSSRD